MPALDPLYESLHTFAVWVVRKCPWCMRVLAGSALPYNEFCDPLRSQLGNVMRHHPLVRLTAWIVYMVARAQRQRREREQCFPIAWRARVEKEEAMGGTKSEDAPVSAPVPVPVPGNDDSNGVGFLYPSLVHDITTAPKGASTQLPVYKVHAQITIGCARCV